METYNAKLISADFEKSTMEFEIQHEFDVKAGDYVIMQKADYDELIKENTKVQNMEKEFTNTIHSSRL